MNTYFSTFFLACSLLLISGCATWQRDEPFDMDREEQICNNLQREFPLNSEDITEMASVMRSYNRSNCDQTLEQMQFSTDSDSEDD